MREFDNQVQKIKNEILIEVAKNSFESNLEKQINRIPFIINPGPEPRFRCCIHHERAVSMERITMVMGGNEEYPHIVEVLETACDQCPVNRYVITETCRGCLAHRCQQSCPTGAISFVNHQAVIDYHKCVECGKCKTACPYNAIADVMRPCIRKCPTGALKIDHRKKAVIDHDLCIACGQCVYQCPFGAIQERSEILPVIELLKNQTRSVYAIVAPAFATQFDYVNRGQVITAIKLLGFRDVVEVALGADLVIQHEAEELLESMEEGRMMTTSCCPGFVNYIEKAYPELKEYVSNTVSPMTATSRLIKKMDPDAVVVFVGPCIAKKTEKETQVGTDYVLTFEELAALIEAKDIELETLKETPLNNASYYGRNFAASGGVSSAIDNFLQEKGIEGVEIATCNGISECDRMLKLMKFNRAKANFVEGMACEGGCIKGPVTMHHGRRDIKYLEVYSKMAFEPSVDDSLVIFDSYEINMKI